MHDCFQMNCLFGCEGEKDSIKHYLQCEPLWNQIFQRLRMAPYSQVLDRLGLMNPSRQKLLTLAIAFVVYHKGRAQARAQGVQMLFDARWISDAVRAAASTVKLLA